MRRDDCAEGFALRHVPRCVSPPLSEWALTQCVERRNSEARRNSASFPLLYQHAILYNGVISITVGSEDALFLSKMISIICRAWHLAASVWPRQRPT